MLTILRRLTVATIILFSSICFADPTTNMLLHNLADPVGGNPKGNITVVEFFDYQCSHCMLMAPTITAIIKTNPDVRVVFKDFPIRGPMSELAARAALAANLQGKYITFNHNLLTTTQFLTSDSIMSIAKRSGLNTDSLKKAMNSTAITNQINNTYALAKALNIMATPAFYIGPTNATNVSQLNFVLGEMSQAELQQAINKAK